MIKGITNKLNIHVEGAELTSATKIEFYVKQSSLFLQYTLLGIL